MPNSVLHKNIENALKKGMTVTIATAMRKTKINKKHTEAWGDVPYFMTDDSGKTLMITRQSKGKPLYDCIDGCRVTAA